MFENQIKAAKTELLEHVHTGRQYEYLRDLCADENVHPFYAGFFTAEVEWWLLERRMLHLANPRFNYENPDFSELFDAMDELSRREARFDAHDLKSILDLAVKTRINYLLRPRTTLKWFVFRGEPTKPLHEVLLRLNYFNAYSYLIEGFRQWAEARSADKVGSDLLSVVEFERALETIDNDEILDYSTTEFADLLDPIFEFFAEVDEDTVDKGIPTPALIVFLDDKGVFRISQELEKRIRTEHLGHIRKADFLRVIEDVLHEMEEDPELERPGGETDLSRSFDVESALGTGDFSGHAATVDEIAVDDDDIDKYVISASFTGDEGKRSDALRETSAAAESDTTPDGHAAPGDERASEADPEAKQSAIYKIELVSPRNETETSPDQTATPQGENEADAQEDLTPVVEVSPEEAAAVLQADADAGFDRQVDTPKNTEESINQESADQAEYGAYDDAENELKQADDAEFNLNTDSDSDPADSAPLAAQQNDEDFPLHDPAFDAPRRVSTTLEDLHTSLETATEEQPETTQNPESVTDEATSASENEAVDTADEDAAVDVQTDDVWLGDEEYSTTDDSETSDSEINKNVMEEEPSEDGDVETEEHLNKPEPDSTEPVYSGSDDRENRASLQPLYSDDREIIDFNAEVHVKQNIGWQPGARENYQHSFQDSDPGDTFSAKPILLSTETESPEPESPPQVNEPHNETVGSAEPGDEDRGQAQSRPGASQEQERYASTSVDFIPEHAEESETGTDLNTAVDSDLNTAVDSDLNADVEPDLNTAVDSDLNTAVDSDLNAAVDSDLNADVEPETIEAPTTATEAATPAAIEGETDGETLDAEIDPVEIDTQVEQPGIAPEAAEEIAADRIGESAVEDAESATENVAASEQTTIEFAIDGSLRTKIIRKVFGGSEDALDQALATLAGEKHWKAALNRVDLILAEQDVNPMSPAAAAFREVVINRFAAE